MEFIADPARLCIAALCGIALLLVLIIKGKLQPLIAILISALGIGLIAGMPVSMIESVSKTGDTYALSYNTGSFDSLFKNIFSMAYDSVEITDEMKAQGVTEEMLQISMDLSKADFTMTVKDGKIVSETVDMAMQMVMAGEPIDMTLRMDLTLNKTGDAVTVQFPADLDSYMTAEEAAAAMEEAMSGVDNEVTDEE